MPDGSLKTRNTHSWQLMKPVVNAVMHRDYGLSEAIHCMAYRNRFCREKPGGAFRKMFHSILVLKNIVLDSVLRNPKLVEWMRFMKDERGKPLVRALSEGTRRMCEEMERLDLPAPYYETGRDTFVTLYNRDNHLADRSTPNTSYATKSKPDMPPEQGGLKKHYVPSVNVSLKFNNENI